MNCKNLYPAILLVISFLVYSCQPEPVFEGLDNPGVPGSATPVQSSVQGKVVDENDQPVSGAVVRSGANTTTTDERGLFRFYKIQLDKYASVVTVEKSGYFKSVRTFSVAASSVNYIALKLVPKIPLGTVEASSGGAVDLQSGSKITIGANSVVLKSNGQPYAGLIKIYASYIDPTSADIPQRVPGSFQAVNAANSRVVLTSYGMMAVELEAPGGESLQIAPGKKAILRMNIPASLQAAAPATIPLWYLNENDGLWKEEGSAVKTNNYYEGEVGHFSFWNCDISSEAVFLQLKVITGAKQTLVPNTMVRITRPNFGQSWQGSVCAYTDSLGLVSGWVFNNEVMLLEILSFCNEVVYSKNIGPFNQNTNLGSINVTFPPQNTVQVTGTAVNCSNQPVANGYAVIYFEGKTHSTPITNGSFSSTITRCSNANTPVEVIAVDISARQQSDIYTGQSGSGSVNTGVLTSCGTSSFDFINYTIDGTNYVLTTAAQDSMMAVHGLQGNTTIIQAFNIPVGNKSMGIWFSGNSAGTFPIDMSKFYMNQYRQFVLTPALNVTITRFGNVGQPIEGSFSGQVREAGNNALHTVSANFKVTRTY
jgi:hypothetical protein